MSADLHIHSLASDGTQGSAEIVNQAKAAGLKTIALTDHDNVDGLAEALRRGSEVGLEVIPGIELSSEADGMEIHLLGYFIDPDNRGLKEALAVIQADRVERIHKIIEKLKELKVELSPEEVFAFSGKKAPGRPHVARALIKKGIVPGFKEAFIQYLDWRAPAYVPHFKRELPDVISLIVNSGGIAVFAHPGAADRDAVIPEMVKHGLRGIEAYYPGHRSNAVKRYLKIAEEHDLLVTGGTDFHGFDSGREIKLGEFTISDELVDKLRDEHARRNQS